MYKKILKRVFDLFVAVIVFPFIILLILFFGIVIKITDKGPIIYKSKRLGKNNKVFNMYKLRTMKVNAPLILNKDGSTYNSKNDERVTKIGKFLRETSIDEVPQFINVLVGDMSLIGPRASLKEALGTFEDDEKNKSKVKPGITGYTQAYYRNSIDNREKRLKDAWYADNVSFALDLKIFFKTIGTVFKRKNIYKK
ncbi:MAG: sugar transferase [Bacilli bacterium]|jgi:lipopolysaccharide/colanic/teichoic acid biosynthesis glycosyltransferase|nr:sugar transferase [Bacilli bacterium]